jgi:hypothetical protein
MTPIETAAIFGGIPAAFIGLVAAIVYGGSARRAPRYRPGRPFHFQPVWFVAAGDNPGSTRQLTAGSRLAIEARHTAARGHAPETPALVGTGKGGARGTW